MTAMADSISALAGTALGTLFYGGLWWTVRRAAEFRHPALCVLGSWLLRMGIALGGFYLVAREGDWVRLVLCFLGFASARAGVTWVTRAGLRTAPKARHAP